MSFNPNFTITNRMTRAITSIERARGFLEAAQLSADWVREAGEQALLLEAHHTTHIEGTRLTLDQAERLWKGEAVPEADPDDARELLNYRTAFEFVTGRLDSGDPITEGMIRKIHRKPVEGVRGGSAAPGEYRHIQNYVVNAGTGQVLYTPPTAVEVPAMMSEAAERVGEAVQPCLVDTAGFVELGLAVIGGGKAAVGDEAAVVKMLRFQGSYIPGAMACSLVG
jgi:Fic family protein